MSQGQPGRVTSLDETRQGWVNDHLWLATKLARKMAWLAPKTIDGDVHGPAQEGLVKAATSFDPSRGKTLAAFAYKWIVGEIFDAIDRKLAGSSKRYRAAVDAIDEEAEDGEEGAGEPLDRAAASMCICSTSLRWSEEEPSPRGRILKEELGRYCNEDQTLFIGRVLEGVTWEALAAEAGVSVSTVKRRVSRMRSVLLARLRARGVRGTVEKT